MNSAPINRLLDNTIVRICVFLTLLFLLLPPQLTSNNYLCEIENVSDCLDSSWVLSLNWALQKNLIFGKDYIFNYGALGFLATRNVLGLNRFYFIFFDLFIISNLAFIIIYIFKRYYSPLTVLLTFLSVLTAFNLSIYNENLIFILLAISIFWLNYSVRHNWVWGLGISAIITAILFFIKVNTSFVAIIIFYCYLLYFLFKDRNSFFLKVLFGLSVPFLILLLSFPLHTDLPGYVLGGLNLIDGYNDAMNHKLGYNFQYAAAATVIIFAFAGIFFLKNLKNNFILFITYGIFSFVLFKQAFVRSDSHVTIFFALFPTFILLLLVFYKNPSKFQIGTVTAICLCCLVLGLKLGVYTNPIARLDYIKGIFAAPDSKAYENSFNRFVFPPNIVETIGQKSVDIIPWNINHLYFNNLNYNPRPVIQSYTVYTPYLSDLNRQKYESDSAPEFVVFSNQTIDNRYAFFDDQEAKLSLIKKYKCLGSFNSQGSNFLLFQRNLDEDRLQVSAPVEEFIKLNENYVLKDTSKAYFIKAKVNYSLFGKVERFLYKPFQPFIVFTLEDGSTREHRLIARTMENGVLINPYIENETDFMNFANGLPPSENKRIKSFKIVIDSPNQYVKSVATATYDNTIKLSVSEFTIKK